MKCKIIRLNKNIVPETSWPELNLASVDLLWNYYFDACKNDFSFIAHTMLKKFLARKYKTQNIEIIHDNLGKPEAIISGVGNKTVSITHNGKYVAVCTSELPYLGIDVQEQINWGKKEKQLSAFTFRELNSINKNYNSLQYFDVLTILWTIKEAVCKALGIGLLKGMHSIEVVTDLKNECEIFFREDIKCDLWKPVIFITYLDDMVCSIFLADVKEMSNEFNK